MDGKFYNIPDNQLDETLIPAEEVKNQMNAAKSAQSRQPKGATGTGDGELTANGYCWRNCWSRNCWRNSWRNCY